MPDLSLEQPFLEKNLIVAGVDEAGRGPWAGPVVAAAVILDSRNIPESINDSKKLSAKKREALFDIIKETTHYGIGVANIDEIDELNILGATKLAMIRAVEQLPIKPDIVLIDGNQPPKIPTAQVQSVIKGDAISLSIAAASILAKVTRDRIMQELGLEFPAFGWEKNAGYGTKQHQDGLLSIGVTKHHRKSFAPIRKLLTEA